MKKMSKKIRALIVENDPTYRSFWKRLFKEMEISDVYITSDPLRAMRLLAKENFNLLISDVIIPHVNGYELAKFACRKQPNVQILLTTGYTTDLSRFDLEGCKFHLLHKPFSDLLQIKTLILHLLHGENVFDDASEDSFSENEDYPLVTEWKL